jgi:hypothetical protein
MHQSYLADHRIMKRTGLTDDGALVFSRPSRRPVHLPVASTADGPSERSA